MSKANTLGVGLAGAAALLMLSACVSRDEFDDLDGRVSTSRTRSPLRRAGRALRRPEPARSRRPPIYAPIAARTLAQGSPGIACLYQQVGAVRRCV